MKVVRSSPIRYALRPAAPRGDRPSAPTPARLRAGCWFSGQKGGFCVPITATYPLVTALFAVLFLGEPLSPSRVLGALLIVAGVYFVR
jgi:hypothetical protein